MATKKVSNDELARMIQEGFLSMKEEMHERMDRSDQKFDNHVIENRKDHNILRFKLSETVSRVEHNQLKVRVETVEGKVAR